MEYQDASFNIDHGYLEGMVRGFKSGILKQGDYLNLVQCETLEGKAKYTSNYVIFISYCYISSLITCVIFLIMEIFLFEIIDMIVITTML